MSKLVQLHFVNPEAEQENTIVCAAASVSDICAWYGAFYAGDEYEAFLDGDRLILDRNGQIPDGTSVIDYEQITQQ